MSTELGTAYIQVLPSAAGMKGHLSALLKPEGDAAGKTGGAAAGASFKAGLLKAAKAGAVAAGTAAVTGIALAVSQGAALEQSLGGIETLFKGSADQVKQYASESFRTVGMSANDYMQTVTSFSASMISSLGGNTAKAAELSNQAMIDMADNANKMGTDLEVINQTYQSLARGNYAMLDNLKLGYGGTKSELERLLADAERISGMQFDIGNFSDITQAIHIVQQNLGITGTTAKEAATTVTGSLNQFKASWSDLLGQMALGNDISTELQNLGSSLVTFAGNLLPMIGNVLKGAGQAIWTSISATFSELSSGGVMEMVSGLSSKIAEAVPDLLTNFGPKLLVTLGNLAISAAGALSGLIIGLIKGIFSGLWSMISAPFASMVTAISDKMSSALSIIREKWSAMKNVLKGKLSLVWGVLTGPFEKAWEVIQSIKKKIKSFFPLKIGRIFSNLKLPHIRIDGGKAPFGIGGKGRLPSFGVDWYAKGGIFNGPSIIGVGEAGPEAVLPIEKLQGMLNQSRLGEQDTLEAIAAMLAYIAQRIDQPFDLRTNKREFGRMVREVMV